jgi:phosphoribosylamine---glycine ligase
MKLLVIGSGGREHALVWKLAASARVSRLWCAPGNAGMSPERLAGNDRAVECVPIGAEDLSALVEFGLAERPDLTIVGPDNPLALGIVDLFQKRGLRIWGVNRSAARFESSKVFAQEFMERYGIPTARAGSFDEPMAASRFAASLGGRCAVKADGLALGKGVFVCRDMMQADEAIESILVKRTFGDAGRRLVIQEWLQGIEISLHAFCDGTRFRLFPTSQDHKRALDFDQGPNTGGMGCYSPTPFLTEAELARVSSQVLDPWLRGCHAEGIDFRGILYPGIMLTTDGPKVLEFNARFGDPETQVYLARLESDLLEVLEATVDGQLDRVDLRWSPTAAVCVVLASAGYPGSYFKGKIIRGLEEVAAMPHTKVFHAGTARQAEEIVTAGGRVLGVTAWAPELKAARAAAYRAAERIEFDGVQYRRDIGAKALG